MSPKAVHPHSQGVRSETVQSPPPSWPLSSPRGTSVGRVSCARGIGPVASGVPSTRVLGIKGITSFPSEGYNRRSVLTSSREV